MLTKPILLYWVTKLVALPVDGPWDAFGLRQEGAITVAHVDRVYYFYPSGNTVLRQRNQAIAHAVAAYCRRQTALNLPDVLLYLFDQSATNPLTSQTGLWVSYERYEGEFRPSEVLFHHESPCLSVSVAAYQPSTAQALRAVRYGVQHLSQLQAYVQVLEQKGVAGTEQDLARVELPLLSSPALLKATKR